MLAECIEAAGLPPGVFNVVPAGRETGDYLMRHLGIDKISFTGSSAAGKQSWPRGRAARAHELRARRQVRRHRAGGREHRPRAARASCRSRCRSQARCVSRSRACSCREKRKTEMLDAYVGAVRSVKVGDPMDAETQMGPLTMQRQLTRVQGYIEKGREEGAKLVLGGGRPKGLKTVAGSSSRPCSTKCETNMTIAKEEIFGPVVSFITYKSVDDAIEKANSTIYGLHGAVYTRTPNTATRSRAAYARAASR